MVIMKDLELELGITLSHMQSWRGRVCSVVGDGKIDGPLQVSPLDARYYCMGKSRFKGIYGAT